MSAAAGAGSSAAGGPAGAVALRRRGRGAASADGATNTTPGAPTGAGGSAWAASAVTSVPIAVVPAGFAARTWSATSCSRVDEAVLPAWPSVSRAARTALLVRPSSFASAETRMRGAGARGVGEGRVAWDARLRDRGLGAVLVSPAESLLLSGVLSDSSMCSDHFHLFCPRARASMTQPRPREGGCGDPGPLTEPVRTGWSRRCRDREVCVCRAAGCSYNRARRCSGLRRRPRLDAAVGKRIADRTIGVERSLR